MTSGNVPEVMAGQLAGRGVRKEQLHDFSISELKETVRLMIQESAAKVS